MDNRRDCQSLPLFMLKMKSRWLRNVVSYIVSQMFSSAYPLWFAKVITLILVSRHSVENRATDLYICLSMWWEFVFHWISVKNSYCLKSCICLTLCWYQGYCSEAHTLLRPASLILLTGLVPKPSRKMAKTWDQKQTRSSPLCFKHAARQQWRNFAVGHVPAAFYRFPAAKPNVFQTMELSLPSVSCKHFYVSTQGYV